MRRLLLTLVCLPLPLMAQVSERPVRLVVTGGLQVPTGDFADYHDYGVHADVGVLLSLGGLRLRPELTYSRFNLKDDAFDFLSFRGQVGAAGQGGYSRGPYDDAVSSLLGGFANLELPLGRGAVQPYLLGGVGLVKLTTDATSGAVSLSDTKASLNLGAGFRFRLGAISGLIEARVNNVPSDDTRAFFKGLRTVPVSFGLVF